MLTAQRTEKPQSCLQKRRKAMLFFTNPFWTVPVPPGHMAAACSCLCAVSILAPCRLRKSPFLSGKGQMRVVWYLQLRTLSWTHMPTPRLIKKQTKPQVLSTLCIKPTTQPGNFIPDKEAASAGLGPGWGLGSPSSHVATMQV